MARTCRSRTGSLTPRGLVRIDIDRGLGGFPTGSPAPFHATGHLVFRTPGELQAAMAATASELIADVPNYTDVETIVVINEIVETAGA